MGTSSPDKGKGQGRGAVDDNAGEKGSLGQRGTTDDSSFRCRCRNIA